MWRVTVWTRWLLLGATPELVAEVKTDQKEMGNGSSPAKEQVHNVELQVVRVNQRDQDILTTWLRLERKLAAWHRRSLRAAVLNHPWLERRKSPRLATFTTILHLTLSDAFEAPGHQLSSLWEDPMRALPVTSEPFRPRSFSRNTWRSSKLQN